MTENDAVDDRWEEHAPPPVRRREPRRAARARPELPPGRVVAVHKGWVEVHLDGETVSATYAGSMRGTQVVVGDDVRIQPPRHESDAARVVERLERRSSLWRTADDTMDEERVVVANADQVVVVLGIDDVERGTRFADRVLVAASVGGLDGAICVNKADLDGGQIERVATMYEAVGYPVVRTSALTRAGLDDLRALLADRWSVLSGHSGVGKSSLFNLLVPGADRAVGELGRFGGRQTSVSSRAMRLPGARDAWLVDTPGVRSFGLGLLAAEDLRLHYPELRELACELDGCVHVGEPGCALPGSVGVYVQPARAESYQRLLSSLRDDDPEV